MTSAKLLLDHDTLTELELTVLQAIEESWATFLKLIDDRTLALSDTQDAYEKFESTLKR